MPDRNIKCLDCQKEFLFSEGEQKYFETRQLSDPKRCKPCRDAKRAAKNERKGNPQLETPPVHHGPDHR